MIHLGNNQEMAQSEGNSHSQSTSSQRYARLFQLTNKTLPLQLSSKTKSLQLTSLHLETKRTYEIEMLSSKSTASVLMQSNQHPVTFQNKFKTSISTIHINVSSANKQLYKNILIFHQS